MKCVPILLIAPGLVGLVFPVFANLVVKHWQRIRALVKTTLMVVLGMQASVFVKIFLLKDATMEFPKPLRPKSQKALGWS